MAAEVHRREEASKGRAMKFTWSATIGVEAVGALSDLTGIWPAVKHDIPGVSTVSDDNTRSWHGRTVRLNAGQAIPPDSHCDGLA